MDIHELKRQSDLSYDTAVAKRNALEKARSRLVMVYNEHIFRADAETIGLVKTLSEVHDKPLYILDTNSNPVKITDPDDFLKKIISRNQEVISAYHEISKTFEKRSD